MSELPLFFDQGMKQEQYKDLLREAEHHRLIKAATQAEPAQNTDAARARTVLDLALRVLSLGRMGPART
jgi:hypothetical protein